jgi:hypothetical protein
MFRIYNGVCLMMYDWDLKVDSHVSVSDQVNDLLDHLL